MGEKTPPGYQHLTVRGPAGSTEVYEDELPPNLLLMDIDMPGLNGFEFLDQLMEVPELVQKDARVFMLTSSTHPLDHEKAARYPLAGYLIKPLEEKQMQKIILAAQKG
jgi:CheY-like chemotaxis protein